MGVRYTDDANVLLWWEEGYTSGEEEESRMGKIEDGSLEELLTDRGGGAKVVHFHLSSMGSHREEN